MKRGRITPSQAMGLSMAGDPQVVGEEWAATRREVPVPLDRFNGVVCEGDAVVLDALGHEVVGRVVRVVAMVEVD